MLRSGVRCTTRADRKIVTVAELLARLSPRRAAGERVVFTNGCFDLLHRGHVRYLAAAAELGEILIIGLNSDASVRGLKESGRPFVPQEGRAEVLAALACVDFVTIFDTPTAHELIRAIRPDVYVKGGDYTACEPVEAPLARALGGEFRVLALVPGSSTSEIVRRIRGEEPGAGSQRKAPSDR